jgi:hypothetical protein
MSQSAYMQIDSLSAYTVGSSVLTWTGKSRRVGPLPIVGFDGGVYRHLNCISYMKFSSFCLLNSRLRLLYACCSDALEQLLVYSSAAVLSSLLRVVHSSIDILSSEWTSSDSGTIHVRAVQGGVISNIDICKSNPGNLAA